MPVPTLETERLLLRHHTPEDVRAVQTLASDRRVAATTGSIPHPYPEDGAARWWERTEHSIEAGLAYVFAMVRKADNTYLGAIGLHPELEHLHAELGYWIGVPYWGQGYTTEAAARVLQFGFEQTDWHRIYARHFAHNPASGRVMQKIGLRYEGTLRGHVLKWGEFADLVYYGLLRSDWEQGRK
jgi:RimJ/RimL family protein N-acetyltransferase